MPGLLLYEVVFCVEARENLRGCCRGSFHGSNGSFYGKISRKLPLMVVVEDAVEVTFHGIFHESFRGGTCTNFNILVQRKQAAYSAEGRKLSGSHEKLSKRLPRNVGSYIRGILSFTSMEASAASTTASAEALARISTF